MCLTITTTDPFDCGANTGCGSEAWFITSNSSVTQYITGGTCSDATPFSSIDPIPCYCPTAASIDPCTCGSSSLNSSHVSLKCVGANRNDDQISSFITSGISAAAAALVDSIDFSNNNLTKVPSGLLSTFPALVSVILAGNKLTSLAKDDLSAMKSTVLVDLSRNQIDTIAAGSLPTSKNPFIINE